MYLINDIKSSASQSREGVPKSTLALDVDVVLRTFERLNDPFQDGSSVLMLNLATKHPSKEGLATTLGLLEPSADVLNVASLLGTKAFLASEGNCVIGKKFQSAIEDFAKYTVEQGLVPEDAVDRITYVEDPNELALVFATLAKELRKVVLYIETARAHELASESQVPVVGNNIEVARNVIDYLSDKANFRDMVSEIGGAEIFPYPRITIRTGGQLTESQALLKQQRLEAAINYYSAAPGEKTENVLFVQAVTAAGGCGNTTVAREPDGTLIYTEFNGTKQRFPAGAAQLKGLFDHLSSSHIDLEVTPYLKLHNSSSYSVMVRRTENGPIAVALQKGQMLDPLTKNYLGTIVDRENPNLRTPLVQSEIGLVRNIIARIQSMGFEGHFDVDTIQYRDRDGEVKHSVSEANMRRDAPSFLLSVVIRHPELKIRLAKNELSLLLDDHVHVGDATNTSAVKSTLLRYGLPLASADKPYGIYLMTPPVDRKGGREMSIAIVTDSDREKYELYAGLKQALSSRQSVARSQRAL